MTFLTSGVMIEREQGGSWALGSIRLWLAGLLLQKDVSAGDRAGGDTGSTKLVSNSHMSHLLRI